MHGIVWLAKASSKPSASVVTLAQDNARPYDIIIVPRAVEQSKAPSIPSIEASHWTRRQLRNQSGDFDPWADAAKALPSVRHAQEKVASEAQLEQLEARLTAKLQPPGDDEAMDIDSNPKIREIEARLDQLTQAQQSQAQQT